MKQLDKYIKFNDQGKNGISPRGYTKIKVHLICDIKYDTRHKARYVADGNLTEVPLDSVCYGLVSLRGLHMMIFLTELNHLDTWEIDIGNAYFEAKTSEHIHITAGQEFREKQENTLIKYKSLYVLRSSGER